MVDETPAPQKSHKKLFTILIAGFLLIGTATFVYWWGWLRFVESTDDAYVEGNKITLMSQISGIVTTITADDTDIVKQGQLLIELDPTDAEIDLEKSKADLGDAVRNVVQLFERVKELKADLQMKEAELWKAALDFEHRAALIDSGSVSQEDLEHSEADLKVAEAALLLTQHQLDGAVAKIENTTVTTHPIVEQAKDKLRSAFVNRERCSIFSPVTGMVAQRRAQVGTWTDPQSQLLSIIPLDQIWITANFKENQLKKMRLGQHVKMRSDIYGGDMVYHGKVIGIAGGTGAVFSILPPQNATGNWIKIVQRLPVRIALDPDEITSHPLRLGLSMEVTVDIHDLDAPMLPKIKPARPLYQTNIFDNQECGVEEMIEKIIHANLSEP